MRTTIDLPDKSDDTLPRMAAEEHTSIRSLVLQAIEKPYQTRKKAKRTTAPLLPRKRKPGPQCPDREKPLRRPVCLTLRQRSELRRVSRNCLLTRAAPIRAATV